MKLKYVIIYMVVFWVAAAFSNTSNLALAICYGLGLLGAAWVLVAFVNWIIKSLKS